MDYPAMWTLARELANTNSTDFSDTRLLPFFNAVKDDLFSYLITWAGWKWNWDYWTTTSVANQTEYVVPEAASDTEWNLKISWLAINYNWDTETDWTFKFTKARLVNPQWLPEHWNHYTNNQDKNDPIYYVADRSVFIAPHPVSWEAWAGRIELKWIKSITKYTITTTESNIKIPLYLHETLVQWVLPYVHRAEWRKDEASFEEKKYEDKRDLAVTKFTTRSTWPHFMKFPNDWNNYEEPYTITIT